MALILIFFNIFDLFDSLAVVDTICAVIPILGLGHSSSYGKTEDKTQSLHLGEMQVWHCRFRQSRKWYDLAFF